MRIACFITSHGFGHATRSIAVLNQLEKIDHLELTIFSSLPNWFFQENLKESSFKCHKITTDVGLVQKSPFEHELESTLEQLNAFLEFKPENVNPVIEILKKSECNFIFSDISPLGIYLGNQLKIPACLLENFTWDWIYESYLRENNNFLQPIKFLKSIFKMTDLHIQTEPICFRDNSCPLVNPIFRPHRKKPYEIKKKLGIVQNKPIILITTGGIPQDYPFLEILIKDKKHFFILTGDYEKIVTCKNFMLIPHQNDFYYPDLIHASNGVVGKEGYGTVSEIWGAQKPFIPIFRDQFRESIPLRKFVKDNIPGFEISNRSFQDGDWVQEIEKLHYLENSNKPTQNGSEQAAEIIYAWSNIK